MNEDEITKLKLMICHLDLSVETKEKLYNQAHKIRNQLQQKEIIIEGLDNTIENLEEVIKQKENIIKEVREYIDKNAFHSKNQNEQELYDIALLEILDKGE